MAIDVNLEQAQEQATAERPAYTVQDVRRTACCIVGGGPGGVVLALLLARQGIDVTLLEKHRDFDRDFRGDTLHPSVMELLDQLGLADRLLQLPHTEIGTMRLALGAAPPLTIDFGHLKTRFPYITFMPQVAFLDFVAHEAAQYPNFHRIMNADVRELVERDGVVRGVRYQGRDGWHEVRALLTVGADGRFSRLRHLIGFEPIQTASPMDVLWFRLPRRPADGAGGLGAFRDRAIIIQLDRDTEWQMAYVIPKGGYKQLQAAGLPALRQAIAAAVPLLADRVDNLTSWKQLALLSVESSRVPRWYKPGLLLIGDAAHVMSPVAGVGINYAIQDAVVAANVLSGPLQRGKIYLRELAAVQRQREWPTRVIQRIQSTIQDAVLQPMLASGRAFTPPPVIRLPFVRDLMARIIGFGVRRVRLNV